jgi:hypothetical protein
MRRRLQDMTAWHRWFAWHPVQVSEAGVSFVAWLEWVERKRCWCGGFAALSHVWIYRMPKQEGNV